MWLEKLSSGVLRVLTPLGPRYLKPSLAQKLYLLWLFFFFSSRRRHTRFDCDWSSDVCSSDLYAPSDSSRTAGKPKRQTSKDERKRSHQDGSQAQARAFERGVEQRFAFFVFVLGKLNNKDRVLRSQTDEHDQTDLGVDVVLHATPPERRERAEHGDRCS